MSPQKLPLVAIVGRPNVGKSTLFNRIVGKSVAVVDDFPGVTRDRREAEASWTRSTFRLVDTGGLVPGTQDSMETAIKNQVEFALEDADVILFLIDARDGLSSLDRDIAEQLRGHGDSILLVANKVERDEQEPLALEAAELGFGMPLTISGQHGRGTGDMLDALVARLPATRSSAEVDRICFTLLGRPNVGKSSLANRLLGEPRLIVHEVAGTTRDAVDVPFRYDSSDFTLVDTAGLRRRSHVETGVEYYSTLRTRRSLERSDVALLVLDASGPITQQDARIAGLITEAGKSLVFLLNKWDLVEKETGTAETFSHQVRDTFPLLVDSPILYVSALTGLRVSKIPPLVRELYEERKIKVATSKLNDILQLATERVQPPVRKDGKPLRFYYVTQVADSPPTLVFFSNYPKSIPTAYQSYLKNAFRQHLGFKATPLKTVFRERRKE